MTQIIIQDELAERLQAIARRENRPVEAVLESLLGHYQDETALVDPLAAMDGMFDDDITDLSTTVRETMQSFYQARHDRID